MAQLKNNEGITAHLQRIFIYGDEMAESHRVHAFLQYLSSHINPFTKRPYELGERSLYRYIGGEMQFPCDLLRPLASWSLDEKLMDEFGVMPFPDENGRILEKIAEAETVLKQKQESIELLRKRLVKPMGKRRA